MHRPRIYRGRNPGPFTTNTWGVRLSLWILVAISLSAAMLPIRTYTSADGLARDHVLCIVQDSRAFIWFCTAHRASLPSSKRLTERTGSARLAVFAASTPRAGTARFRCFLFRVSVRLPFLRPARRRRTRSLQHQCWHLSPDRARE